MKSDALFVLPILLAVPAILASVILRSNRRSRSWLRTTATVLSDGARQWGPVRVSLSGQAIPITFSLPSGSQVTSNLTLEQEADPPTPGATVEIVYDPADPRRVEVYLAKADRTWQFLLIGGLTAFFLGVVWVGVHR